MATSSRLPDYYTNPRRLTRAQWARYENVGLRPELDLDELVLNWTDRRVGDLEAKGALVGLQLARTIEGGSTVTMTLRDPNGRVFSERARRVKDLSDLSRAAARRAYKRDPVEVDEGWNPILAPDVIGRAMEVELDGVVFRLVQVRYASSNQELTLTFEDRIVYWLKRKHGPKRANRAQCTRAQFVLSLLREVRARNYRFVCPELSRTQPVDKPKVQAQAAAGWGRRGLLRAQVAATSVGAQPTRAETGADADTASGLAPNARVLVKGRVATPEQRRIGSIVMGVADAEEASEKARLALMEACIVESEVQNLTGGHSTSQGVLQLLASTASGIGISARDPAACAREFLRNGFWRHRPKGAMELVKAYPTWSAGKVAQETQGSAYPERYDQVRADAQTWLDAWKGGTGASANTWQTRRYQFARNSDENSWEAMQRLASEVAWRLFVVGNSVYFMSETQLYARRPRYEIRPEDPAVVDLAYDIDWGKPTSEASLTVALDRWGAPPGSVVVLSGWGPPDGRWLVTSVSRDWFSPTATVALKQPGKAQLEPANERSQRATNAAGASGSGTDVDSGSKAGQVYEAARRISQRGYPYTWGGGHARAGTADGGTGRDPGPGYDCSGSVCAALAAAGMGYRIGGPVDVSGTMASSWGQPGRGRQLTVWANSGHVWMQFHGIGSAERFDTSPYGSGGRGPRLRSTERPTSGFVARHWPGV